jgi:hypothetical protein
MIAAPTALLAFRFLARVDSYWMCGAGMAASAFGGLVSGAIGVGSSPTNYLALLGTAACGGVFAACLRHRSRITRGLAKDPVPNKLIERFGKDAVREFEGVHLVVTGSLSVRPGEVAEVCFHLQNCHDAPGEFVVKVLLPKELESDQRVRVPTEARVRLAPLAVGVMKLPILTTATLPAGNYPIGFELGVDGLVGRRVRRWRSGKTVENAVKPWQFATLTAMGKLTVALVAVVLDDSAKYLLHVEGTPVPGERPLPPVAFEYSWNPEELTADARNSSDTKVN